MARFQGSKAFVTVQASAAKTTSGTTAAFDEGNNDYCSVLLDVTAVSGAGANLAPVVQWSHDGVNWFDADPADAFTAITATGKKLKQFTAKGLYGRVSYTITGTTPSFTFAVHVIYGS